MTAVAFSLRLRPLWEVLDELAALRPGLPLWYSDASPQSLPIEQVRAVVTNPMHCYWKVVDGLAIVYKLHPDGTHLYALFTEAAPKRRRQDWSPATSK